MNEKLSSDFADDIDAICDRFERAWVESPGNPTVDAFLPELLDQHATRDLLVELICIDMEHRWRAVRLTADSGGCLLAEPLLEDYVARYPKLGQMGELPFALVAAEYHARQTCGDRPNASDYRARFPHLGDELVRRLRSIAAESRPLVVSCYRDGHRVFSAPLGAELELGRQMKAEPPPYLLHRQLGGPRLVIAPLSDRRVSRHQLFLAHEAVGRVLIENRSERVTLRIDPRGVLHGGVNGLFDVPVLLHLHCQQVRVAALEP
ncbi:MAG: hypothetical protein ACC628_11930 [Pirellulaceae bacterium]